MPEQKTKPTTLSVSDFLNRIPDEGKRLDAHAIVNLMKEISGHEPVMWGETMIGFGSYHYKYASGHEGDYFLIGFSPRKSSFSIYLMCGLDAHPNLLERLGKYKMGKSCLYINKLSDVDLDVFKELIRASFNTGPKYC